MEETRRSTGGNIRRGSEKVEEEQAGLLHLFLLDAGTAAGTGQDRQFLCRIEKLLFQASIQMLEVLRGRRSLEIEFISLDLSITLCVFLLLIDFV